MQLTEREYQIEHIVNLHKSAYGFKPRWEWDEMSDSDLDAEAERLSVEAKAEAKREDEREALRVAEFEGMVADTIAAGAKDRETAIRWLRDAEGATDGPLDYFEYLMGLPYGYLTERNYG